MIWWQSLVLLFGVLTVLLLVGLPAGFAFLAINLVGAVVFLGGEGGLMQVVRNGVASVTNFSLTPIPFFILMGEVLFHTGLAMRAIDSFDKAIRGVPARLSVVAIVSGTVFSAISGSTIATTAGVMMAAMFLGWIIFSAWRQPELAPQSEPDPTTGWARWGPLLINVTPLVLIFAMVIVAMSVGWATPTESAALGALVTVIVCVFYRSLTLAALGHALMGTAAITGVILFIIIGATTFSQILSFSGATNGLVSLVKGGDLSPWMVMAAMIAMLLLLGCFVDQVSMMLITLPFFMPLVQHFGWDPLWFGVIYLICMQLGLLTPPFGMLLFTMRGVAPKEIPTREIFAAVTPYVLMGVLMVALVLLFPGLATGLPALLLGK